MSSVSFSQTFFPPHFHFLSHSPFPSLSLSQLLIFLSPFSHPSHSIFSHISHPTTPPPCCYGPLQQLSFTHTHIHIHTHTYTHAQTDEFTKTDLSLCLSNYLSLSLS